MMQRLFYVLAFLALSIGASDAATCFAVGGTFTWDNSTDAAHWASSSGGTGGTCAATGGVPKNAADTATFDGSSGGGTVTNNVDLNITTIVTSAFTGTLDFATNNHNVTLSGTWTDAATGVHTVNMGNGTWTINPSGNGTNAIALTASANLTLNANSSTLVLSGSSGFTSGARFAAKTFNAVQVTAGRWDFNSANGTFSTLSLSNGVQLSLAASLTFTITTASPSWTGTRATPIVITNDTVGGTAPIISYTGTGTIDWGIISGVTFSGGTAFNATNSVGYTTNTGLTIQSGPSAGGGGRIIGG